MSVYYSKYSCQSNNPQIANSYSVKSGKGQNVLALLIEFCVLSDNVKILWPKFLHSILTCASWDIFQICTVHCTVYTRFNLFACDACSSILSDTIDFIAYFLQKCSILRSGSLWFGEKWCIPWDNRKHYKSRNWACNDSSRHYVSRSILNAFTLALSQLSTGVFRPRV